MSIKKYLPPILYDSLRKVLKKPEVYAPSWQTLHFSPLENFRIFMDPRGKWQSDTLSGIYDDYLWREIRKLDLEGKTVLDVGAFIGFHSFYFSRLVGDRGKVYAFEPGPANIERINLILKENKVKNVEIMPFAISDTSGSQTFHLNQDIESGRSSGGFIESANTIWDMGAFKHKGFSEIKIETKTLDSLSLKPDVIKIDVEGAEYLVLKGAINTLQKYRPVLYIEIHSMWNMFHVTEFLTSNLYKTKIIHQEKDGRTFIEALPS